MLRGELGVDRAAPLIRADDGRLDRRTALQHRQALGRRRMCIAQSRLLEPRDTPAPLQLAPGDARERSVELLEEPGAVPLVDRALDGCPEDRLEQQALLEPNGRRGSGDAGFNRVGE